MPHNGFDSDIRYWGNWAVYIFENGLGNIYRSDTDYLPLFHYILKIFGVFQESIEKIWNNIHYLKSITLLFHFITGFFLISLIKKKGSTPDNMIISVLFYLLNIAILYNTVIWGQVDGILTCFAFIACYFAFKKKVLLSLVFTVLAINFKLQAIIFLPVVGFMLLPVVISTFSIKKILQWILIPVFLQIIILLPFILSGTLDKLWLVVTGSVGRYPLVSLNAYNIWDFILSGDLMTVLDSKTFIGFSYKQWGLLMFFGTSGIALFPLLKSGYLSIRRKTDFNFPIEKFLLLCGIIPLLFFYFNTQMHERYSHPAFVFLIAYSLYTKKPFISIIGCLAYLLNLEGVLRFMHLPNYETLVFNRDFISSLYLLTIFTIYIELFEIKFKNKKLSYVA
ncbi:MAG: hypothetical protein ACK5MD_04795 [Flavobacteriales bacterium]